MKPELNEMAEEIRQAEEHLRKAAEIALGHDYLVFVAEVNTIRLKIGKAMLKIGLEVENG